MKHYSYLNTAARLIREYDGKQPLHHFLKNFFHAHGKYGSRDRKRISHLCYVFFRLANAVHPRIETTDSERVSQVITYGLFLCGDVADELLALTHPNLNLNISRSLSEKVAIIDAEWREATIDTRKIFPDTGELSHGIDRAAFSLSHLSQPDLFLRVRPGYWDAVVEKLTVGLQKFEVAGKSALRLPNGARIEPLLKLDKEVVVQDLSSQSVGHFLESYRDTHQDLWDCCAASGGKSLLASDVLGDVHLTVSDIRASIIANLKKRFAAAGIERYDSLVADLSVPNPSINLKGSFDMTLADLPCTGSGTWGRTPEQLYFFDSNSIARYADLQKKILLNVIPYLKPGGKLLYSTCSVFNDENEKVVEHILGNSQLELLRMEVLKGYDIRADTMFAALLVRK